MRRILARTAMRGGSRRSRRRRRGGSSPIVGLIILGVLFLIFIINLL